MRAILCFAMNILLSRDLFSFGPHSVISLSTHSLVRWRSSPPPHTTRSWCRSCSSHGTSSLFSILYPSSLRGPGPATYPLTHPYSTAYHRIYRDTSLLSLKQAANRVCELSLADLNAQYSHVPSKRRTRLCFHSQYAFAMLRKGFGLQPLGSRVLFLSDIQGWELDWALGSALYEVRQEILNHTGFFIPNALLFPILTLYSLLFYR